MPSHVAMFFIGMCVDTGGDCWGQSYGYDRYGNLTGIASTQCSSPTMSVTVNAKNQGAQH